MQKCCSLIGIAAMFTAVTMFSGCGGGAAKRSSNLSGTVTYKGEPVPRGNIQFRPAGDEGGVAGYANIVSGKYNTAEGGQGVNGGTYTVLIAGYDGVADPDAELPMGKPLFPEFKMTVDVPKGEDVVRDFNVQPQTD